MLPKKSPLIQFFGVITIPTIYGITLLTIISTPNAIPNFLLPIASLLSAPFYRSINLTIALLGILVWLWSWWHLRPSFGVLPQKHQIIVTTGPYRYLNHPMYLAIFITFSSLALANLSTPGFLTNLLILTPINILRSVKETQALITSPKLSK